VIVIDASAAVEWLLSLPAAGAVEERLSDADTAVHAPHLLAVEVAQVVRRHAATGWVSLHRAGEALVDLADFDVVSHPHEPLLPLMWQLRHNLTAYDAAYVALSLALDAPLVTCDRRLAAAPHGAAVNLITAV